MNLFDQRSLDEKVADAIKRIQTFAPKDGSPLWVGYSGGKDSDVLKSIVLLSGITAEFHYNRTTIDPPEIMSHIKSQPDIIIDNPARSMFQLILWKKMLPTRLMRFCCDHLKDRGGEGRTVLTGVRWAESSRRANSVKLVRPCIRQNKTVINPILDFTDEDVWAYIREMKIPTCSLYAEGFTRCGCIGCPMTNAKRMSADFQRWPGFLRVYYHGARLILPEVNARRIAKGKPILFTTPKEFLLWWLMDSTKERRYANVVGKLIDEHCIRRETCK